MAKKKAKKVAAKKAKAAKTARPARAAKAAKKTAAKGRWTAPGAKDRAAAAKAATRAPRQEPLIKGLRIRSLDNVAGHISNTRAAIARLQGEEADLERQAHELMKKHDQTTWQHAGVALSRIPGEEKLRVTTVRSRGPAPAAEPEAGDDGTEAPVQTEERAAAVDRVDDDELDREHVEA
jgi:hypothetical protein